MVVDLTLKTIICICNCNFIYNLNVPIAKKKTLTKKYY